MIFGEWTGSNVQEAVVNHLWQSTAVVLLIWALSLAIRKNPASLRYRLWMLASAKFVLPFSLLITAGRAIRPAATDTVQVQRMSRLVLQSVQPYAQPMSSVSIGTVMDGRAAHGLNRILTGCLCLWAVGVLAMLVSWLRIWLELHGITRRAQPAGEISGVPVVRTESTLEPGVFGILKPVLLISADLLDRLPKPELETIYAHELCHVHRRDNLTAAFHAAVQAAFWFHPAVWLIRARLMDERERACDEAVVASGRDAAVYARSILDVCRFYLEAPADAMAGVTGGELKGRILHILNHVSGVRLSAGRKVLIACAVLVVMSLPVVAGLMNARPVQAQADGHPLSFEVASIRPSRPGNPFSNLNLNQGRVTAENVNLLFLLKEAFGLNTGSEDQIVGAPAWLRTVNFDIKTNEDDVTARALEVMPPDEQRRAIDAMLRKLIEDRFELKAHMEYQPRTVAALVIAKGGSKLQPLIACDASTGNHSSCPSSDWQGLHNNGGHIEGRGATTAMLANMLAGFGGARRPHSFRQHGTDG